MLKTNMTVFYGADEYPSSAGSMTPVPHGSPEDDEVLGRSLIDLLTLDDKLLLNIAAAANGDEALPYKELLPGKKGLPLGLQSVKQRALASIAKGLNKGLGSSSINTIVVTPRPDPEDPSGDIYSSLSWITNHEFETMLGFVRDHITNGTPLNIYFTAEDVGVVKYAPGDVVGLAESTDDGIGPEFFVNFALLGHTYTFTSEGISVAD